MFRSILNRIWYCSNSGRSKLSLRAEGVAIHKNNNDCFLTLCLFFILLNLNSCFASTEIEVAGKTITVSDLSFEWSKEIIADTVENSYKKITKDTDIVFNNALYRKDEFVEKVYENRRDQDYWIQEFARLVLTQKNLNALFKESSRFYKENLKNTLKTIAKKMIEIKIVDAEGIVLNVKASKDLERLRKALPTAEEIANDIYVELEKKGHHKPNFIDYLKKKIENIEAGKKDENSDSLLDEFIYFITNPDEGLSLLLAPIYFILEVQVSYNMEAYKIDLGRAIRTQRNNYKNMLIEGYTNLLVDSVNRMEKIIDKTIDEYGKGLNNVVP